MALESWAVLDGYAVSHGMPHLLDLPLDRFANYVYWMATKNLDEQGIEKFRAKLWRPPRGEAPAPGSPWSPEAETSAFQALKAAAMGSVRSGE